MLGFHGDHASRNFAMTLRNRIAHLEQQHGHSESLLELVETDAAGNEVVRPISGAELQQLIRAGYFQSTQDMIDTEDDAP